MLRIDLVLFLLACAGHGRRMQNSNQPLQRRPLADNEEPWNSFDTGLTSPSDVKVDQQSTLKKASDGFHSVTALTMLLLALTPAAAFVVNAPASGKRMPLLGPSLVSSSIADSKIQKCIGCHAPVMNAATVVKKTSRRFSRGRELRKKILNSPNHNRQGFKEDKAAVEGMMVEEFTSPLLAEIRANGGKLKRGDVTVTLAEKQGLCWGVERAVAMAYQSRTHFPDEKIHITNELIHNPQVNDRLREMDVKFIEPAPRPGGMKNFDDVKEGDVVILPAFGATIDEMQLLNQRNVKVVDTTCPWVSKVWNAVDKHVTEGKTTIIHGKWAHEETVATSSFCEHYLIIKDQSEADYVVDYILNGGNKAEFLEKFKNAMSKGFDPDKHLKNVGLANQTTMYKKETKQIGRTLERAMLEKYGPEKLSEHYAEFDTICDATQERQDAVTKMSNDAQLDFILVVGGWDSSNTAHLKEIPEKFGVPAYHVDRAERIGADNTLEHREHDGTIVKIQDFLKRGPLNIGVTSGASTPDMCVEDALERIFMLHKLMVGVQFDT